MLLIGHDGQILRAVIEFVTVSVVNVLGSFQWSLKHLRHNEPVFSDAFPTHCMCSVAAPDGSGLVWAPEIAWVEEFFGVKPDPQAVHVAERKHSPVPPSPLAKWFSAVWNLTDRWSLDVLARTTESRIGRHLRSEFEGSPPFQSTQVHAAVATCRRVCAMWCDAWLARFDARFPVWHASHYKVTDL